VLSTIIKHWKWSPDNTALLTTDDSEISVAQFKNFYFTYFYTCPW